TGDFYWNSGMFVWRATDLLTAMKSTMTDTYERLLVIGAALGTDREQKVIAEIFPTMESVSIDFGVMEQQSENTVIVPGRGLDWSDIGSWDAWGEHQPLDEQKNASQGAVIAF